MVRLVISRVKSASVSVSDNLVSSINAGLLVYLGINKDDNNLEIQKMAKKVCNIRLWDDSEVI